MRWNVVAGLCLLGFAAAIALDPDYPIPRAAADPGSTFSPRELLPIADRPVGTVAAGALEFGWRWAGPPVASWQLVVLDAGFAEIARQGVDGGGGKVATRLAPELAARLAPGRRYHWTVEGGRDGAVRSAPVAFELY